MRNVQPGEIVDGRFRIDELIAIGGFGAVYKAWQTNLNRTVALKVIYAEIESSQPYVERLQREALVLSKLQHKNIVSFYGCGYWEKVPFIALEWVKGQTLAELLGTQHTLDLGLVLTIAGQSCEALAHAHSNGSVHRDLKPNNIIISDCDAAGGAPIVRLVDFGLAKLMPQFGPEVQKLTQTGEAVGSVLYMSPEQCLNQQIDARSDIYSLGVVLYHCVSGNPPYLHVQDVNVMQSHVRGNAPPLVPRAGDSAELFESVAMIINKATKVDRDARYQNAEEMLADVARASRGEPLLPPAPSGKSKRIHTVPAIVACITGVCVVLAGAWLFNRGPEPTAIELYTNSTLKGVPPIQKSGMPEATFIELQKIVLLAARDHSFDATPAEINVLRDRLIRAYFERGRVEDAVRLFGTDAMQDEYIKTGAPYDELLSLTNVACNVAKKNKNLALEKFFKGYREELLARVRERIKSCRSSIALVGLMIGIDQVLQAPKSSFEEDLQLAKEAAASTTDMRYVSQSLCFSTLAEIFYWTFHDDKRTIECCDLAMGVASVDSKGIAARDHVAHVCGMLYWYTKNWRQCVDALSRCRARKAIDNGAMAGAYEHLGLPEQARRFEEEFLSASDLGQQLPGLPGLIYQITAGMRAHGDASRAVEFRRRLDAIAAQPK